MTLPKNVLRSFSLVALVGGLLSGSPCWAENRLEFAKPIVSPELQNEELLAVPLDSDIYQIAGTNFPDLRIRTATGEEIAFLVRRTTVKKSRTVKEVWTAKGIVLHPQEDNGLEITFRVDTKKHPDRPQGIRLISPLKNFEHRVQVETSTDRKNWQPLAEELIFDYSQFMNVRNTSVELPKPASDHAAEGQVFYRILIDQVTQQQQSQLLELSRHLQGEEEISRTERQTINRQPFRINRIELWHDTMRKDVIRDLQVEYPIDIRQPDPGEDARGKGNRGETDLHLSCVASRAAHHFESGDAHAKLQPSGSSGNSAEIVDGQCLALDRLGHSFSHRLSQPQEAVAPLTVFRTARNRVSHRHRKPRQPAACRVGGIGSWQLLRGGISCQAKNRIPTRLWQPPAGKPQFRHGGSDRLFGSRLRASLGFARRGRGIGSCSRGSRAWMEKITRQWTFAHRGHCFARTRARHRSLPSLRPPE